MPKTYVKNINNDVVEFEKPLKTSREVIYAPTESELFDNGWYRLLEVEPINENIMRFCEIIRTGEPYELKYIIDSTKDEKPPLAHNTPVSSGYYDRGTDKYYISDYSVENDSVKRFWSEYNDEVVIAKLKEEKNTLTKLLKVTYTYNVNPYIVDNWLQMVILPVLGMKAQEYKYDDLASACSYKDSPNEKYNTEGTAFFNWRTETWEYIETLIKKFEENDMSYMSTVTKEDIINGMPKFSLDNNA